MPQSATDAAVLPTPIFHSPRIFRDRVRQGDPVASPALLPEPTTGHRTCTHAPC